ncbi:MAG TPA: phage major capsid protein [Acidimicrobiia bacterium]|nr:phage major capsid protein [Acidimicrobiia bacterium]
MKKKREDLKRLLGELGAFQQKMGSDAPPTAAEAEAMDAKAHEAEGLQAEIKAHDDRQKRYGKLQIDGKTIVDAALPNDEAKLDDDDFEPVQRSSRRARTKGGKPIAGYMRLGDYVVGSKGFADYQRNGLPKNGAMLADVPTLLKDRQGQVLVALTGPEIKSMMELKAVPTIGDTVIEPTLVPDFVRVLEQDRLRLRDILDVSSTTSDAVKYTRLVSYTRGAATVAPSALKPEAAMELDTVTEAVRTIAVHIPVEEQQLADYPALSGIINNELLYDLDKHLEELIAWGDGTGENFLGIMNDPDVLAARSEAGDTLIDIARRGITDVRRAGYEPNGILADPLDWEDIVLLKGTDEKYIWVVVTEGETQRLWGVPVIETVAMEDFQGVATEERGLLVGDFRRGATLWDRQRSSISVGFINDQFIRNQRTILAELRAAFGVKRPGAFRRYQTQAPSAS